MLRGLILFLLLGLILSSCTNYLDERKKVKLNEEKVKLSKHNTELIFKTNVSFIKGKIRIFKPDFPVYWNVFSF